MSDGVVRCMGANHGDQYSAYWGDSVDVVRQLPSGSVDFSVYSPPFAGLYIYSDSICDMGNVASDDEFFRHYGFLLPELHRVMRPGRLVAVHCKDLVYYQNQRGSAGLRDFPGALIAAHTANGFDFHARITIWRDPVREMTKTKARGLLYKQLRADATYSRVGLPEYFLIFRKWSKDESDPVVPVTHTHDSFPLDRWQQWASPVWMDTRETDVLEAREARDVQDEKHICPMPLDLTSRAITMWSNPGETVLSPFMGIGSEGYCALKLRRKFIGIELKESYWRSASKYLETVDAQSDLLASVSA